MTTFTPSSCMTPSPLMMPCLTAPSLLTFSSSPTTTTMISSPCSEIKISSLMRTKHSLSSTTCLWVSNSLRALVSSTETSNHQTYWWQSTARSSFATLEWQEDHSSCHQRRAMKPSFARDPCLQWPTPDGTAHQRSSFRKRRPVQRRKCGVLVA